MKISLIVNFEKEKSKLTALNLIKSFENKNDTVFYCQNSLKGILSGNNIIFDDEPISKSKLCIVIGGDGTIIHTAKIAALNSVPILGINTGRIGYLASLNPDDAIKVSELLEGEYSIDERMMLNVTINNDKSYTAFNDAVLSKGSLSRMIDIKLNIDTYSVDYRADGLIVSTPTGSTAYALSAGGPVIDSRVNDILITPICPYDYFNKALIIPEYSTLKITTLNTKNKEAFLTIDGEVAVKITDDDLISITKSDMKVKLINFNSAPIYERLERKNF